MLPTIQFTVGFIAAHQNWFKVNREYQRDANVWTNEDKRHLIDTVLKDLDIPKVYLRELGDKNYEIVDGQQRIKTLRDFRGNKFVLDGVISGKGLDGKKYRDLPANLIERFDSFQLTCVLLRGYDDDKIRELFAKLQRGKPLNPAEKLNAFPGNIVLTMREVGNHDFFNKVRFPLKRYKAYHVAA